MPADRPPAHQPSGQPPVADWLPRVLDQAADAIFVTDLQSRFVYVNEATVLLVGLPAGEFLGRSVLTVVAPSHHAAVLDALQTCRQSDADAPQLLDIACLRGRSGEELVVETTLRRVRHQGKVVGCVGIGRSLPARQAHLAERLAAERVAAVVDLAKSAAHKINNPLAILLTHLAVLERGAGEGQPCRPDSISDMKRMVERIAEATQELAATADTAIQKALLGGAQPELATWVPPPEGEDAGQDR